MSFIIVGAYEAKKGELYQAVLTGGNAFRVMEDVRFSINKSPFAKVPVNEDIMTHPTVSYSPEQDTTVLLTRVPTPNMSVLHEGSCPTEFTLSAGVESASICNVSVSEEVTAGHITCASLIRVPTGTDVNITIKSYDDGVLYKTSTAVAHKNTDTIVVQYETISALIALGSVMSFTLTADAACTVEGAIRPNGIQIEQTNL